MASADHYAGPRDPEKVTHDDVHQALAFLIALEPDEDDDVDSDDEYEATLEAFREEEQAALRTLRLFAEQAQPQSLEAMQATYYSFTNDPRYLETSQVSGVVTTALSQAWDGVGPWTR
jgi:hypothetical protein